MAPLYVRIQVAMTQPLAILYRDKYLVAVHKPSGLLVHRSKLAGGENEFLLQQLRNQLGQRVYPVHRLDRPTSGVMVMALDSATASRLGEAFREHQVSKRYLAVVRGFGPERERLDYTLREEDGSRPKAEMPALEAITEVERLAEIELPVQVDRYPSSRYSLMAVRPVTGRRHQIRRHLAQRGYPIIGDAKHGKGNHNRFFAQQLDCARLLLAAVGLDITHPIDGRHIQLSCGLDATMAALFQRFAWAEYLPVEGVHQHTPT